MCRSLGWLAPTCLSREGSYGTVSRDEWAQCGGLEAERQPQIGPVQLLNQSSSSWGRRSWALSLTLLCWKSPHGGPSQKIFILQKDSWGSKRSKSPGVSGTLRVRVTTWTQSSCLLLQVPSGNGPSLLFSTHSQLLFVLGSFGCAWCSRVGYLIWIWALEFQWTQVKSQLCSCKAVWLWWGS